MDAVVRVDAVVDGDGDVNLAVGGTDRVDIDRGHVAVVVAVNDDVHADLDVPD